MRTPGKMQVVARAGAFDQRFQRGLLGRTIHDCQGSAQRDLLGGAFETAQVWRQEHNTAPAVEHGLHVVPVFIAGVARHPFRRGAPDEGQFDDGLARLGDGLRQLGAIAGALEIGAQPAPVRRRRQIHQPAERGAEKMQSRQGQGG